VINPSVHSPLLGFAFDGFPIYGAYGYQDTLGLGTIVRMKSSYSLRNITTRTTYSDGTDVVDGPPVSSTFPLGWYREDYEYIAHPNDASYLDIHNGRFCVTPEYPNGIYCYFTTVDANHNSYYPYCVGPTYYGIRTGGKVTAINEITQTYSSSAGMTSQEILNLELTIYPNPSIDLIAIQSNEIVAQDLKIQLINSEGKVVQSKILFQGSSICHLEIDTIYTGTYTIRVYNDHYNKTYQVVIQ